MTVLEQLNIIKSKAQRVRSEFTHTSFVSSLLSEIMTAAENAQTANEARVAELLAANNAEVERRRAAEAALTAKKHDADCHCLRCSFLGPRATQGLCETTLTERHEFSECVCGTYQDNLGPCRTYLPGPRRLGSSLPPRCVYCDHKLQCHTAIEDRFSKE